MTFNEANAELLNNWRTSNNETFSKLTPADVEFYERVSERVTSTNALPFDLPAKAVFNLIIRGLKFFWEWYDQGTEARTLFLPQFEIRRAKGTNLNKQIVMPNGIEAVIEWKEVDGHPYGDNISQYIHYALLQNLNTGASWTSDLGGSRGAYRENQTSVVNIITGLMEIQQWKSLFTRTIRATYNKHSSIFSIQSEIRRGMVIECLVRLPPEQMYNYYLFEDYIVASVEEQLGKIVGMFDFSYPGAIQPNFKQLNDDGKSARQEIETELKESTNNSGIIMTGD